MFYKWWHVIAIIVQIKGGRDSCVRCKRGMNRSNQELGESCVYSLSFGVVVLAVVADVAFPA